MTKSEPLIQPTNSGFETHEVVGVILAGGLARRMGGIEKPLIEVAGRTIIEHLIESQAGFVGKLIINANGSLGKFERFGLPVVEDTIEGHLGPLAGILTAMEWVIENRLAAKWIVSLPGDTPFMPQHLTQRMTSQMLANNAELACAASNGRNHPVVGVWPVTLAADLREALQLGMRKIDRWTMAYELEIVEFSASPYDPFFNINTAEDLIKAEKIVAHDFGR